MKKRAAKPKRTRAAKPRGKAPADRGPVINEPMAKTKSRAAVSPGRSASAAGGAVATIAGAARALGVHERTVKTWLARGAPGAPGNYDVQAIAVWHASEIGTSESDENISQRALWETRRAAAAAQFEELRLEERRGHLVDVGLAARHYARHIAEAKVMLEQLPDRLLAHVPAKLPRAARKIFRERIHTAVVEVMSILATGLAERPSEEAGGDEPEADA